MDYFVLVNHIMALIISIWGSNKICIECLREYKEDRQNDGTYESKKADIFYSIKYQSATSCFIKIAGGVLTVGFTLSYVIQDNLMYFSCITQKIISSGIYLPILLMICGKIISCLFNIFSNEAERNVFSNSDCVETIFIISILTDICLFFVDSNLGLWVLAIILGRIVWTDYVYTMNDIFNYLSVHRENIVAAVLSKPVAKINAMWLDIQYARNYFLVFFTLEICYNRYHNFPHNTLIILICYTCEVMFIYLFIFQSIVIVMKIFHTKNTVKKYQKKLNSEGQ